MRIRLLCFAGYLLSATAFGQTIQLVDHGASNPWVAVGAERVATVWRQDNTSINAAILDGHGTLIAPPFFIGTTPPAAPHVAAIGDTFLVTWRGIAPDGSSSVRAAIIDSTGVVQMPFSIASSSLQSDPVVVGGQARFLVLWFDGAQSWAAWVNTAGAVESRFRVTRNVVTDAVVTNDTAIAVWVGPVIGWTKITGNSAGDSGVIAPMPGGVVGFGSPYIQTPAIAGNGSGYYVAWRSGRTGRQDNVEGTRLALDMTPLDVNPSYADDHQSGGIVIQSDFLSPAKTLIRVCANGWRYFVSWTQSIPASDLVRGRYIGAFGRPISAVSFPITITPPPNYDAMETGTSTLAQDGSPIAVYTMAASHRLFIRYTGAGPRSRVTRR